MKNEILVQSVYCIIIIFAYFNCFIFLVLNYIYLFHKNTKVKKKIFK